MKYVKLFENFFGLNESEDFYQDMKKYPNLMNASTNRDLTPEQIAYMEKEKKYLISRGYVKEAKLIGKRIQMRSTMKNDPNPIKKDEQGTIISVEIGLHALGVKWDNGRILNVIEGIDYYDILD